MFSDDAGHTFILHTQQYTLCVWIKNKPCQKLLWCREKLVRFVWNFSPMDKMQINMRWKFYCWWRFTRRYRFY